MKMRGSARDPRPVAPTIQSARPERFVGLERVRRLQVLASVGMPMIVRQVRLVAAHFLVTV